MTTEKETKQELFAAGSSKSPHAAPTSPPSAAKTAFTPDQLETLKKPIEPSRIQRRTGFRGQQFEYLPIHDIVETANRIFGFGGWQREIRRLEKVYQDETEGVYSVGYLCEYRVRVGDIVHEDVGFGSSSNQPDLAQAHEMAVKGAVSDAIKRCFRAFGDQFGLSLYKKHDFEEITPSGPRTATEAQLARLRKTLRAHSLKEETLLEYIKAKMGSDFSKLEELPLKVASRAIERFTQDEAGFVQEIREMAQAK
jgi:DNA repair and recombination protein RAD52